MRRGTALAGLGALAVASTRPLRAQTLVPLRLGTVPQDSGAECYYGHDSGIFAKHGIDAQINGMASGPAIASAVLAGALDIGFSNMFSLEAAYDKGLPFTLISAASVYDDAAPTSLLIVAKDSPIRTAHDLDGKTVSTNGLRNIGEYGPSIWIDKNGGDSSTMKFTEMPFPEMPVALASGRVDSAFPAEPFITIAKDSARVLADAFASVAPRFNLGIWVTSRQWADAHKDLVSEFAGVMSKTAAWSNNNHAQSAAILAKYAKLDPSIASSMARVPNATRLQAADMQPVLDLALKYGTLPTAVAAEQLIYRA
jgi:NitT/TauT family transport system substrate-binding protein